MALRAKCIFNLGTSNGFIGLGERTTLSAAVCVSLRTDTFVSICVRRRRKALVQIGRTMRHRSCILTCCCSQSLMIVDAVAECLLFLVVMVFVARLFCSLTRLVDSFCLMEVREGSFLTGSVFPLPSDLCFHGSTRFTELLYRILTNGFLIRY